METLSAERSFGGVQGVYRHASSVTGCDMTFAVFMPPQAEDGPVPVLWYLSGLTCTHANVMEKGEYRRVAAELGLAVVCPDTSPRGENVPDEDNWQFGSGAGFYLDATVPPYDANYRMYSYILDELPGWWRHSRCRHDARGHFRPFDGRAWCACDGLRNAERFRSCSAFAPIVNPSTADWPMPSNAISARTGMHGAPMMRWRLSRTGSVLTRSRSIRVMPTAFSTPV